MPFRFKFNLKDKCVNEKPLNIHFNFKKVLIYNKIWFQRLRKYTGIKSFKNKIKVFTLGLIQMVGKSSLEYWSDKHLAFNVSITNHQFTFHTVVIVEIP